MHHEPWRDLVATKSCENVLCFQDTDPKNFGQTKMASFRLVIRGRPVSYKRQRIGKRRAIPQAVRDWRDSAIVQLMFQWARYRLPTILAPVEVTIAVYLGAGQRMDAISAAEGALDVMQVELGGRVKVLGAGIIRNDKQAKVVHILELRDRKDPRIEIDLRELA